MKRLELLVEDGALAGQRFAVPSQRRLGRSSSNDIAIRDEELSRNHCLFEPIGPAGLRLTDLASANGTYLNGKRLGSDSVDLQEGDVIRVGSTRLTVVGDTPPPVAADVDLGLGPGKEPSPSADDTPPCAHRKRSPFANVLWGFAVILIAAAAYFVINLPPAASQADTAAKTSENKPELVEMRYEKVTGDSESIFRYFMSLTSDGALHVAIDDLAGEGRHINRSQPLSAPAKARLADILRDEGFAALDREYIGPQEEPPKLNSWSIQCRTTTSRKSVNIVNMPEPDAFRRIREKLEAFSMNELGIRALQYSREKLLEMAHAAADTGRMKWEDRDVEYGNLHASICAYREALSDLETINPKPPEYAAYAEALEQSKKELDTRYDNQRFVAEQATSVGDWEKAKVELRTLCEMLPDREDDRHREAAAKLIDVEKRLGRKGGRK